MSEEAKTFPDLENHVVTAANTMLGDLMNCVVDLAKAMPTTWQEMSEAKQDEWLALVDRQCSRAIRDCVHIIATRGSVSVPAVVDSVTFKDGVKVVLKMAGTGEGAHMVADHQNGTVMICMADYEELTSDNDKPKADPDQSPLALEDTEEDAA